MSNAKSSLRDAYPEIAAEWHPTKNGRLTPDDVSPASVFKAIWACRENPEHMICQRVDHRVRGGGCKLCRQEQFLAENSLAVKFPDIARQWHPTKNGDLKPDMVSYGSSKKVWWQCDINPEHSWSAFIHTRTAPVGRGCRICADQKLFDVNSLAIRYPRLAAQWHPTANGGLTPNQVNGELPTRVFWLCEKDHTWNEPICDRTTNGKGCPECYGQQLLDETRLSARFLHLAAEWHPTMNQLSLSDVSSSSREEVWWQCRKNPAHKPWKERVWVRTQWGTVCPGCIEDRSRENSLENRFPEIAKLWHPTRNAPVTPAEVNYGSIIFVWWKCAKNADHVYQARISDMRKAHKEGKSPCVFCRTAKQLSRKSG